MRKRLERVSDIKVLNAEHGIRIAQALFAENYFETDDDRKPIIGHMEEITVFGDDDAKAEVSAFVKTGRYRSAIASELARDLGLIDLEDLLWYQQESGEGKVPVVEVDFELKDIKVDTEMIVSKRLDRSKYKLEIGRRDLENFIVRVESK